MHRHSVRRRRGGVFLSWGNMTVEIITTVFIAKPEDLDKAYALYQERIAQAPVNVLAYSAKPIPHADDYELWSLRMQATFDRLDSLKNGSCMRSMRWWNLMSQSSQMKMPKKRCGRNSSSKISGNQRLIQQR